MKDYKAVQVRTSVKNLIKTIADSKGVSQAGLLAAIIYTLDGRQDFGIVELNWAKIRQEYPPPLQIDKKTWAEMTNRLVSVLDEYEIISILEVCSIAKVNMSMVWVILSFLYRKGKIEMVDRGITYEETLIILDDDEKGLFEAALERRSTKNE